MVTKQRKTIKEIKNQQERILPKSWSCLFLKHIHFVLQHWGRVQKFASGDSQKLCLLRFVQT